MEIKKWKLREIVEKVGLPKLILLVLAGIMLLVFSLPEGKSAETGATGKKTVQNGEELALDAMEAYAKKQQQSTEEILSQVAGIGTVKVKLTLAASEERVPLQDNDTTEEDTKEEDGGGGNRDISRYETKKESILIQKDGEDSPYVVQITAPSVEGVVVVAQGAASAKIQREIIEAIQALFPIEAHKIKVMKME